MTTLLQASEVAKRLHISVYTLRRYAAAGKIGFVKVSEKKKLFTEEHVEAFIKRQTVGK